MENLSPMMKHYLSIKKEHPDCVIFYRLGDFYEMFFDDAVAVSKELELTLTGKVCGLKEKAPMCGVPHHSVDGYLTRLVQRGYKVAIVEQVEDPSEAKGLVRREVVRIVTPGTITSEQALDETKNNYIMCIVSFKKTFAIATADISTGDFFTSEVESIKTLNDEIYKFMPAEVIHDNQLPKLEILEVQDIAASIVEVDELQAKTCLMKHFKEDQQLKESEMIAAGVLLLYLYETQMDFVGQLTAIVPYQSEKYMVLDTSTRRNLELTQTLREKGKKGSLLGVLDHTKTAMGARMLRQWIEQPLVDKEEICKRQDAISEWISRVADREEIREYLDSIYDLERIVSKVMNKTANPRELISFRNSLKMLTPISAIVQTFDSTLMRQLNKQLDRLEDVYELIEKALVENPPIAIKEAGMFKEGYNESADGYRKAKTEGKTWLAKLEEKEKEKTGIKNLKIKYNKVFGYCIEVTNSAKDQVPDYFIRKQTLVNAERFITEELKQLEDEILGAENKLSTLEYELFCELREKIGGQVARIQASAKAIAALDVLIGLADVAVKNKYTKPEINTQGVIDIKDGRHPVVEILRKNEEFIANDTYLNNEVKRIAVITGPNMAGKSTYMRQTALIVLMAQIGSFVPVSSAQIGICDRIFTRVGAADDLASGQSTFMVEMNEVANILKNATSKSLLILDEIGRGTSTYDGMSIAWAVIEYISKTLKSKTLFATHYHELTDLEGVIEGVNNYCIAVEEKGEDIVFLRKIISGGADKSYGIQVARLAEVPEVVLKRAKEIMGKLNTPDTELSTELLNMNLEDMTPMEALNTLYKMQARLKKRVNDQMYI
ncbi:DNA mismatch repair protein MutS [Lachnospiraceae bacterium TWA4]|nr:DNA mismatch repair protein MutS [Lachnospiraceae bacterium TWA4]